MGISHVGLDGGQLEIAHESLSLGSSSLDSEADNSAGTQRQIFFYESVIGAVRKIRVVDPGDPWIILEELSDHHGILSVAGDPYLKAFDAEFQKECIMR